MKDLIIKIPVIGPLAQIIHRKLFPFPGSKYYWTQRYDDGGSSGDGSYGQVAEFKAKILNRFVVEHGIKTLIEWGCGDGNQLKLAKYPSYRGFDVSAKAISMCRNMFFMDSSKRFDLVENYDGEMAELALSLDVIYHLVEDESFNDYMQHLFDSSFRFVIIYSSNTNDNPRLRPPHVKHRAFSTWIDEHLPHWQLISYIANEYPPMSNHPNFSFADFYIYEKQ
jgi:hypothetical protein